VEIANCVTLRYTIPVCAALPSDPPAASQRGLFGYGNLLKSVMARRFSFLVVVLISENHHVDEAYFHGSITS
jgi:hypothetical protein